MSTDEFGNVHERDGKFGRKPASDTGPRLFPLAGLSESTREAIRTDMIAQRGHMVLRLENLREDAERVAAEAESLQRSLNDLDDRIADLPGFDDDEQAVGAPSKYRGPDHVDDTVEVAGYGTFTRRREGVFANQPYAMRVQVDRELSNDEARHLAQLVGYDYSKTGGERLGDPHQDAPNSIVVYADTTKGRAYRHLDDFELDLESTITDGSPLRKTDRSGAGTKGTRLVEGLSGVSGVHIYYDSVLELA